MMKIEQIMNREVKTLKADDTLKDAVTFFSEHKIGGAPVVDNENNLEGILCEMDIIKFLKTKTTRLSMVFPSSHSLGLTFQESIQYTEIQDAFKDIGHLSIGEIMTTNVITAEPGGTLDEVAPMLLKDNIKRIPIVNDGKVVGIITRRDIIKGLIAEK